MNNSIKASTTKSLSNQVLSDDITEAIAISLLPTSPAPEVASRIKAKLMARATANAQSHAFVFANQGEWKVISTGVSVKLLRQDTSTKSFLIKMDANTSIASHLHLADEESYVLDGEVWLEGVLCSAGDYHFAAAGCQHQKIYTNIGCTILVKSA